MSDRNGSRFHLVDDDPFVCAGRGLLKEASVGRVFRALCAPDSDQLFGFVAVRRELFIRNWPMCHRLAVTLARAASLCQATLASTQPQLYSDRVYGESDPEGDSEELLWLKMSQPARGKKDRHNWPRRRDAQENHYSSQ